MITEDVYNLFDGYGHPRLNSPICDKKGMYVCSVGCMYACTCTLHLVIAPHYTVSLYYKNPQQMQHLSNTAKKASTWNCTLSERKE